MHTCTPTLKPTFKLFPSWRLKKLVLTFKKKQPMATDTQLAANNLFSSGALPLSRLSTPTMPIFFALCHFFQLLVSSVAILVHSGLPWSSTCFLSIFPSVTFLSGESCLRIYPISMWWYVSESILSACDDMYVRLWSVSVLTVPATELPDWICAQSISQQYPATTCYVLVADTKDHLNMLRCSL